MKTTQLIFVLFFLQTLPLKAQTPPLASMISLWDSLLSVPGKCQYSGYSKDTLRIVSKLVATVMQNNGVDTLPTVILPIGINIKFLDVTHIAHPIMLICNSPYTELPYPCLELETALHRKFAYLSRSLDSILDKCITNPLYKKNIDNKFGNDNYISLIYSCLNDKLCEKYTYCMPIKGDYFHTKPAVTDIHLHTKIGIAYVMMNFDPNTGYYYYYYDNKTQTWSVLSNERSWRLDDLSKMETKAWTKWGRKRVAKKRAKEFEPIIFGGVE